MSAERIEFLKTIDDDHKHDWSEWKKERRWFVKQLKKIELRGCTNLTF